MEERGFWDFKACSKIDVLREDRHSHLLNCAIIDEGTKIQQIKPRTFMIYGEDSALLFTPTQSNFYLLFVLLEGLLTA